MTWTLTDTHDAVVVGPFPTAHDAIAAQGSCPYVRLRKVTADHYVIDAGFSAADHDRYQLVEDPQPAAA